LLKTQAKKYKNDENGINALGYIYLNNKNFVTATAVFKLNIELNPNSWNVYDSMGELYLLIKDTTNAIKYYTKSVHFNPANSNGLKILKNLGIEEKDVIPQITLPTEVLDKYVGQYLLSLYRILTVTRKEGQLFSQTTGQAILKIFPASETRFYVKESDIQITFNKDKKGNVVNLTLHKGGDSKAKKIE